MYICKYMKMVSYDKFICPYKEMMKDDKKDFLISDKKFIIPPNHCPKDIRYDKNGSPICFIIERSSL